jgi:hypothetical protein
MHSFGASWWIWLVALGVCAMLVVINTIVSFKRFGSSKCEEAAAITTGKFFLGHLVLGVVGGIAGLGLTISVIFKVVEMLKQ